MQRAFPVRAALAATAAMIVAAGLSGCSIAAPSTDAHWATSAEMRHSSQGDAVPTIVDRDARDIDYRTSMTGHGTQISWTSSSGVHRDDCKTGALTGSTAVGAAWWPKTTPAEGWTCGWWSGFEQQGRYYAWDNREKTKA